MTNLKTKAPNKVDKMLKYITKNQIKEINMETIFII